jgi:hypothetical protein
MKVVLPPTFERWMALVSQLLENHYNESTKLEVERDNKWHWHEGKQLDTGKAGRYVIIYFRNVGETESITICHDLLEKIKDFAELQYESDERHKPVQVELLGMNCRFVCLQLEEGEVLPPYSTIYEPGGNKYKNAYNIQKEIMSDI